MPGTALTSGASKLPSRTRLWNWILKDESSGNWQVGAPRRRSQWEWKKQFWACTIPLSLGSADRSHQLQHASLAGRWLGLTHVGHPTDRRGYDPHNIHGDFVDHPLLQVPLIIALPAICLECRNEGSLLVGWQGACV